jgi:hypothetical protein
VACDDIVSWFRNSHHGCKITVNAGLRFIIVLSVQLTMEKSIRLLGPDTVTSLHDTEEVALPIKTVEVCEP